MLKCRKKQFKREEGNPERNTQKTFEKEGKKEKDDLKREGDLKKEKKEN